MSSVSVVIPCYNYGHFLDEATASVLDDQDGVDVRVLIIDDASPDGSGEVARRIAARDPRIDVVVHEVNQGHLRTYNEGLLDWADGDYCVLMSADDRLTPGALRRATQLLDAHPEVGFAFGNALSFQDGEGAPVPRTRSRGWSVWQGEAWIERRCRMVHSGIASPEVVVRTSLQHRVGGYDLRLPHTGDQEMWLRLAAHSDVGYLRGVDQAFYRQHGKNMSTGYDPLKALAQYLLAYEAVFEGFGDQLSDPDRLSALVRRRMAREALLAAARSYDRGCADQTPVDELVAFAFECWPQADTLPVYRTLRWRRRIGPRVTPYLQPLTLPAAAVRRTASRWYVSHV